MPRHLQRGSASTHPWVGKCDYLCFIEQENKVQEREEMEEGFAGNPRISAILTVCSDHQKDPSNCFPGGKPSRIAKQQHQLRGFSAPVWCVPARSQPAGVRGCACSPPTPPAAKINPKDVHQLVFVLLPQSLPAASWCFQCRVTCAEHRPLGDHKYQNGKETVRGK